MNGKPPLPGTRIDWSQLHQRLESARVSLERSSSLSPGEQKKLLRARAALLARKQERAAAPETRIEVLEFMLADESYGIETPYVDEVYPLRDFTPLPGTPAFLLGVINLRGQILPVVDIRKFFDLPAKGLTDLNKVIVVRGGSIRFGILADMIAGMRSLPAEEIQASLPTLTGIRAEYLRGITRDRLVVLDARRILSDERLVINERIEA